MRGAGVEPDVNRVWIFDVILRLITENIFDGERLPGLDAALLNLLGDGFKQLASAWVQYTRFAVHEERHRHAPLPLPRESPVRAVGDHRVQASFAPSGEELRGVDGGHRSFAQGGFVPSPRVGEG